MKRTLVLSASILLSTACGDHSAPATMPASTATGDATCKARAAELTSYLTQVFDASAKPAEPWSMLDAETRAKVDPARDKLRKAAAGTSDPKAAHLALGIQRGPMDDTIDGCPQAHAVFPHAAEYPDPDHMTKYAAALGDGVAACDCHVNIPLIRAGFYLIVRGPD